MNSLPKIPGGKWIAAEIPAIVVFVDEEKNQVRGESDIERLVEGRNDLRQVHRPMPSEDLTTLFDICSC